MALMVSTAQGTSWGFGARGMAGITAFDTLELGWQHFTNELQTVSFIGFATLPSDDITVGYHRLMPLSYAFSLVYDYRAIPPADRALGRRERRLLPHRLAARVRRLSARRSVPSSTMAA
jgi:hypothetical protein